MSYYPQSISEISHVTGKDNVVVDTLSRYPELVVQSYDHLLPEHSIHRMTDDFRIRNARLTKSYSYNIGDSV